MAAAKPLPNNRTVLPDAAGPEQKAANLRDAVPAAYLYGAATGLFQNAIDPTSCQVYLHGLLKDAGDPTDPIARMMIEQLAMAHHAIGRLHVRAATRQDLPEVTAYHAALGRLMSEFRKTSLALQGMRQVGGTKADPPAKVVKKTQPRSTAPIKAVEAVAGGSIARSDLRNKQEVEDHARKANSA